MLRFASRLILLAAAITSCISPPNLAQEQTEEAWNWLGTGFREVLDDMLPLPKACQGCVSYRSYETLQAGDLEYSMVLKSGGDAAYIKMPDSVPIGRQLLALHRKHPEAAASSFERELKFKEWEITAKDCPATKTQFEKFRRLRVQLPSDVITLDPTVHEFQANFLSGQMDFRLTNEENDFVRWARETRRLLEACGQRGDNSW